MADRRCVRKFLDLCTSHVPEGFLESPKDFGHALVLHETEYGGLLWVPDDPMTASREAEDPTDHRILAVQLLARKRGCDYVLLDRDGPTVGDLPEYDW